MRPPCSTKILVTLPPVITACAVAPLPFPPTIDTRGDSVYPLPPAVTSNPVRLPLTITSAAAPVPPPPLISTVGFAPASYPSPELSTVICVKGPNWTKSPDLYPQIDTPFIHVPIGLLAAMSCLSDIVSTTLGNLSNFLWLPGIRADPVKGPIL